MTYQILIAFLIAASPGSNPSLGQDFEIERSVIAPGGGTATGDDWRLDGTLGQVAAGQSQGQDFTLYAGFWVPEPDPLLVEDALFADDFESVAP